MHNRRPRLLALALLLLVMMTPLFVRIPPDLRQDPLISPLGDRYHIAVFALLVLVLHRWGPLKGRTMLVATVSIGLGGATELLQIAAGRSALLWDWYQDTVGVGFGVCWLWWWHGGRRWPPVAIVVLLLGVVWWPLRDLPLKVREARAVQRSFPLLADFDRPDASILWSEHEGSRLSIVEASGRGRVLQADNDLGRRWPGIASRKLPWNWTGFDSLFVDVRTVAPGPDSLVVSVWMEDRLSTYDTDDALQSFVVDREWTRLRVAFDDLRTHRRGRPLGLREVQGFSVFMNRRSDGPLAMQVDSIFVARAR